MIYSTFRACKLFWWYEEAAPENIYNSEFDVNNDVAKENLYRLNSNQKKTELQFRSTDLPVYRWTAQMRELMVKYNELVGDGNYWMNRAPRSNPSEICRGLVGWWASAQFAKNYLIQFSSLAHRKLKKKAFSDLSNETFETEKKAFEEVKAKNCAY